MGNWQKALWIVCKSFVSRNLAKDKNGKANPSFNIPSGLPPVPGLTLHHACIVHDATGILLMASEAVPLRADERSVAAATSWDHDPR